MDIAAINEQLTAHEPEQMVLRGISEYGNTLTLAFLCHGGPTEDLEFLVTFENAAIFHLPRILHNRAIRFKRSSPERIKELIPAVSYDESEHNPKGYIVVELTDVAQKPYGYYVMADRVVGKWEPLYGMLSNKPLERSGTTGHEQSNLRRAGRSAPSR